MADAWSAFNRGYYDSRVWEQTTWLGVPVLKAPTDLWMYQELVTQRRPDLIIESGTYLGGSALFLASVCELIGHGRVVSIDLARWGPLPEHPRIVYLQGSSVEPATLDQVRDLGSQAAAGRCLVILDSDHRREHVLAELHAYAPFVGVGDYLVVEDTNVNGHPVMPEHGPGPMEAVEQFLVEQPAFEADPGCEKFGLTFNPRGYLRRVR